jgi:hypothetical protein
MCRNRGNPLPAAASRPDDRRVGDVGLAELLDQEIRELRAALDVRHGRAARVSLAPTLPRPQNAIRRIRSVEMCTMIWFVLPQDADLSSVDALTEEHKVGHGLEPWGTTNIPGERLYLVNPWKMCHCGWSPAGFRAVVRDTLTSGASPWIGVLASEETLRAQSWRTESWSDPTSSRPGAMTRKMCSTSSNLTALLGRPSVATGHDGAVRRRRRLAHVVV